MYLLNFKNSFWFWFLPSKFILANTESSIFSYILQVPLQIEIGNHFIIIRGSSQVLPILLYLHITLWLTYHSDICRGSLTPVQRRYYPPKQQDFNETEWDLNYRFNEEKPRSSFLADFPAVGWCLIISNTPMVYFPSAAVTNTTFVGQLSAGCPTSL